MRSPDFAVVSNPFQISLCSMEEDHVLTKGKNMQIKP